LVKQEVRRCLEELERLQQIVIENSRFTEMGPQESRLCWRTRQSYRSTYSRSYFGNSKDIEPLMNGLLAANAIMQDPTYDAVLAAAASFWFCIHSSLCRW
jgi:hypothetical protein